MSDANDGPILNATAIASNCSNPKLTQAEVRAILNPLGRREKRISMIDAAKQIEGSLLLLMAWVIWFYGWRVLVLDRLRTELFKLRDEWFDAALDRSDGLTFDSKTYGLVRTQFNALIRFAHTLSPLQMLVVSIHARFNKALKNGILSAPSKFSQAIESAGSNDALKARIASLRDRAMVSVVINMLLAHPLTSAIGLLCMMIEALAESGSLKIREIAARKSDGQLNYAESCFEAELESVGAAA